MKIQLIIVFFLTFNIYLTSSTQAFINYGVDREGVQLFQFFHNVSDGYYIDIGAYDSIFASNTLNLETMGWNGINIDASPSRLPRFFYSRPWQPSLNYAIGDEDQYVTLYELAEDSSSTVSSNVKQFVKQYKPVIGETKIPSLSMKQICERFYQRRPLFINLDIEGYGGKALMTNNWKNQKCKPDIIFSQINQELMISGLPMPETILLKEGYKKWKGNVGLNQIYILAQLYNQYEETYKVGENLMKGKNIIGIYSIGNFLQNTLKVSTYLAQHHQPITDGIYYYFTKADEAIDISHLNKYSNMISNLKNRPIMIANFNPHSNILLLKTQNYSTSIIKYEQTFNFYVFTIFQQKGLNFSVYVFDHMIKPIIAPRIIINSVAKRPKKNTYSAQSILNKPDVSLNQKVMKTLEIQLQELNDKVKSIYNETNLRNKQLVLTLTTNHYYDIDQQNKLLKKLQNIQKQIILNKNQYSQEQIQIKKSRKEKVSLVLKKLVFVLFFIFFSFLFAFALLCIAHDSHKIQSQQKQNQIISLSLMNTAQQITNMSQRQGGVQIPFASPIKRTQRQIKDQGQEQQQQQQQQQKQGQQQEQEQEQEQEQKQGQQHQQNQSQKNNNRHQELRQE